MPSDSGRITPSRDISSETEITGSKRKGPSMTGFRRKAYKFATAPEHEDSEPEYETALPSGPRRKAEQSTTVADSLGAAVTAPKEGKKKGRRVKERAEALTNPSKTFMGEQEIGSRVRELSDIARDIPQSLLFDNLRNNIAGKPKNKFTVSIRLMYDKAKNKSKRDATFQLDEKISALESYNTKPSTFINDAARKEISFTLIEAHRLLTDLAPDWSEAYPQLQDLHTHIDTELKKRFSQTSDKPPSESGLLTKDSRATDSPFYETP